MKSRIVRLTIAVQKNPVVARTAAPRRFDRYDDTPDDGFKPNDLLRRFFVFDESLPAPSCSQSGMFSYMP
jgi:hypothetical protein